MDRSLAHLIEVLRSFDCRATLPITGSVLTHNKGIVMKYSALDFEFCAHGHYHIDHTRLSKDEQIAHISRARHLFLENGLNCEGYRSPYLRWNEDTIDAIRQAGFLYDSSQAIYWDFLGVDQSPHYKRALDYYRAIPASKYPSLPRWRDGLLRIPYSLPDDEILVERLRPREAQSKANLWLPILMTTYRSGELFNLGLHPERIHLCAGDLVEILCEAQLQFPRIWIASMGEITFWWLAQMNTRVTMMPSDGRGLFISISGPGEATFLVRGVETVLPTQPWDGAYRQVKTKELFVKTGVRPFIGVSPRASPYLKTFLRQQGYIIEEAVHEQDHSLYLDYEIFQEEDERPLLDRIEQGEFPLVRLCRWPNGARSALCITGDIDALSLVDFGRRIIGERINGLN